MAHTIQHSQSLRPPHEHQAGEGLIAFHTNNGKSLDDIEFKERHGEHYTLRHHLSGCAQTLHTIDFTHDFFQSPTAIKQPMVVLQGEAVTTYPAYNSTIAEMPPLISSTPQIAIETNVTPIHVNEMVDVVDPVQIADSSPVTVESTSIQSNASFIGTVNTANASEVALSDNAVDNKTLENAYLTDFNDGSLGGWHLGGNLSIDQILQEGQLHFSAENMMAGQSLLSQSMVLKADHQYEFQMSVQIESGSAPAQFVLNVNGESHSMKMVQQGDTYILSVSFTPPRTGMVDISVVPMGDVKAQSDIWVDDVMLMPVGPVAPMIESPGELSFLQPEPTFDFAQLAIKQPTPSLPGFENLTFSMMLQNAEPLLFVEDKAEISSSESSWLNMESLLSIDDETLSNTVTDLDFLPLTLTATTQLDILELKPEFN